MNLFKFKLSEVFLISIIVTLSGVNAVDFSKLLSIDDYEAEAKNIIDGYSFNYIKHAAGDEVTLDLNRNAFKKLRIRPNYMQDVSKIDTRTKIFGSELKWPVGVDPMGSQGNAHPDGESGVARAAGKAGSIFMLSSYSTQSIEEVAKGAPDTVKWMQVFIFKDLNLTANFVRRAENNGFKAIVVLLDCPTIGSSRNYFKANFGLKPHLSYRNYIGTGYENDWDVLSQAVTFDKIKWLVQSTRLPVIAKGVLTKEGAVMAKNAGCKGVIVSTHGGRQLDGVPASIEALPEIVRAVGQDMVVMLDSGVRQGTDAFKALALGAKYVFMGRPNYWGLAVDGENGVDHVLKMVKSELEETMTLAGTPKLSAICSERVAHQNYYERLVN